MKIAIDTHTHSTASGHAYSTIAELARGASDRGLDGFVLTDHGPAMEGSTHRYFFGNLRVIPKKLEGVFFFTGVEANIMDGNGNIDLTPTYLLKLDYVLAGLHEVCLAPGNAEENTRAMVAALANPYVDAISHPGNIKFPVIIEEVVRAALRYNKALEINSASFLVRPGSEENCRNIARLSVEMGGLLSCGSDAHFWADVGNLKPAKKLIESVGGKAELVINSSLERFRDFIEKRRLAKNAINNSGG